MKIAVADVLGVGALSEDRIGDVTRVKVGQFADLGADPRAAFALFDRGSADIPHEVIGDELLAPFERLEQVERSVGPDQREVGVYLDHGQAPSSCGNRVAFAGVQFLSNPQTIQLGLEGCAIDDFRHPGPVGDVVRQLLIADQFIAHDALHWRRALIKSRKGLTP